jgi:3-oxoacyl-[acyl-carrier-protein] synthase-3
MNHSRIAGTGGYLPAKVLTNHDLEKMVDTTDEWIVERTGIRERHIAADGETSASMGEQAARRAIAAAGIAIDDIDLIIVATTTPDRVFPSTACLLQDRLGIHGCAAFDVQAVCTGFVYALAVADMFVRTGSAQCALVVGTETLSRIIDWSDRSTCVLFGDGAGAVILRASAEPGIISTHLHADGQYKDLLTVTAGISQGYDRVQKGEAHLSMEAARCSRSPLPPSGASRRWRRTSCRNPISNGWCRTRPITESSRPRRRSWACPWITWCSRSTATGTPRRRRSRWPSTRRCATDASSRATSS